MTLKDGKRLIVVLGIVSLLADVTYEGARSLNGQYLAFFGASAATVGFVAGLGELIGYGLRLAFGWLSDKTKRYWFFTILGYAINLLAVPLLALAGNWPVAAFLMIMERMGKAVRAPARDVILSHAAAGIGQGKGFAIHEALDQIGAILGPLVMMLVLAKSGQYQSAYATLAIPAVLALMVLAAARLMYPHPQSAPKEAPPVVEKSPRLLWYYFIGIGLIAAAYADFPLIAFHLKNHNLTAERWIPLYYALAMAIDAFAALAFGWWYDKKGIKALIAAVILSTPFSLLTFSDSSILVAVGMVLWGIGLGAQEAIIRPIVVALVPPEKRGTCFGQLHSVYGLSWFCGSALMGLLYDYSLTWLVAFSVVSQVAAIFVLTTVGKKMKSPTQ